MRYSHFMEWSNIWGERNPLSIREKPNMFYCWQEVEDVTAEDTSTFLLGCFFFFEMEVDKGGVSHSYYKKAKVFAYTLEWQPAK